MRSQQEPNNTYQILDIEVRCEYFVTGDKFSISWLKTKLEKEGFELL